MGAFRVLNPLVQDGNNLVFSDIGNLFLNIRKAFFKILEINFLILKTIFQF